MSTSTQLVELIIYAAQKPESVLHADCLRRLGDTTVIGHTMRRLQTHLSGFVDRFVVLGSSDRFAERISAVVKGTRFEHVVLDPIAMNYGPPRFSVAFLNELDRFASTPGTHGHFLVLPDACIFPDCELTKSLLAFHLAERNVCTVAANCPFGLVPLALHKDCLANLPLSNVPTGNPHISGVLEFLWNQLGETVLQSGGPRSASASGFGFFPAKPSHSSPDAGLPVRMTVDDRYTLAAAETVQSLPNSRNPDSTAAHDFKLEIVRQWDDSRSRHFRTPSPKSTDIATVLFSSLRNAYSGPEQCLLELMTALNPDRFRPVLAVRTECLLAERARAAGISVVVCDFGFDRWLPGGFSFWTELIRERNVSLVHIDTIPNSALMGTAYMLGVPVVGHLRTCASGAIPDVVYCADRIIAISRFVSQSLQNTLVPASRVRVIYDGIRTEDFRSMRRPAVQPSESQPLRLGMVARINPDKGQDLLVRALANLKDIGPPVQAFLFGDIDPAAEGYFESIVTLIRRYGLEGRVVQRGFEPDLKGIYGAFDALVVCNSGEPLGTCILEALAAGLPVLAPEAGGSCELVRHETEGLLYNPRDAESLAQAIARLAKSPGLLPRLAANAVTRADEFDVCRHAEEVQNLYAELLSAPAEKAAASGNTQT